MNRRRRRTRDTRRGNRECMLLFVKQRTVIFECVTLHFHSWPFAIEMLDIPAPMGVYN